MNVIKFGKCKSESSTSHLNVVKFFKKFEFLDAAGDVLKTWDDDTIKELFVVEYVAVETIQVGNSGISKHISPSE
jgi:hypothetical protein